LKQVLYFLILIALPVLLVARQPDTISTKKSDSVTKAMGDTASLQNADSVAIKSDSLKRLQPVFHVELQTLLSENKFLNTSGSPVAFKIEHRKSSWNDGIFYLLLIVVAALAFLRYFYVRYFNNLFQVFFNTSLRQSQLTDQLLQAKLPSMFFNLIAAFSGGIFFYFLINYYGRFETKEPLDVIFLSIVFVASLYFLKFISLKFTGWLSGYKEVTNTYIFIIFLINKILGILYLPLVIIMAFSVPSLIKVSIIIAILLTVLMFLLRFFRSYGLLRNQLKIGPAHFMLYIAGIEIMPLLLIYKALLLLLSKNI
jgi:hypothetical protein